MENVIVFIIWIVIVVLIRSAAGKGKKLSQSQRRSPSSSRRPNFSSSLPPELQEILKECNEEARKESMSGDPEMSSLPPELQEILKECNENGIKVSVPPPMPRKQAVRKDVPKKKALPTLPKAPHAGESYAAPIPEPYASPMVGVPTPAQTHADAHIGPVAVKDTLKQHGPSATAKHADEHIATTHAVPTPQSGGVRKSPLASWIPRNETDLRKALVMSEILGAPKSLR